MYSTLNPTEPPEHQPNPNRTTKIPNEPPEPQTNHPNTTLFDLTNKIHVLPILMLLTTKRWENSNANNQLTLAYVYTAFSIECEHVVICSHKHGVPTTGTSQTHSVPAANLSVCLSTQQVSPSLYTHM